MSIVSALASVLGSGIIKLDLWVSCSRANGFSRQREELDPKAKNHEFVPAVKRKLIRCGGTKIAGCTAQI
jgi:hypothetical protein